jgi:hypothetical protein
MNAVQVDAICRLREEAFRLARWADNVAGDRTEVDLLPSWGLPSIADLAAILDKPCRRWLSWDSGTCMGDDGPEFAAAVRALHRDASAVLRWIEGTP